MKIILLIAISFFALFSLIRATTTVSSAQFDKQQSTLHQRP